MVGKTHKEREAVMILLHLVRKSGADCPRPAHTAEASV